MSNDPREQHAKFQAAVGEDNFAVGLVNEVVKAFLAATEPRVQVGVQKAMFRYMRMCRYCYFSFFFFLDRYISVLLFCVLV
jgi:hypothetical protein